MNTNRERTSHFLISVKLEMPRWFFFFLLFYAICYISFEGEQNYKRKMAFEIEKIFRQLNRQHKREMFLTVINTFYAFVINFMIFELAQLLIIFT